MSRKKAAVATALHLVRQSHPPPTNYRRRASARPAAGVFARLFLPPTSRLEGRVGKGGSGKRGGGGLWSAS